MWGDLIWGGTGYVVSLLSVLSYRSHIYSSNFEDRIWETIRGHLNELLIKRWRSKPCKVLLGCSDLNCRSYDILYIQITFRILWGSPFCASEF